MITKEEYLKAVDLIKNYKLQNKPKKEKTITKDQLFYSLTKNELIDLLKPYFPECGFLRYKNLIKVISDIYFEKFGKKIGKSYCVVFHKYLIENDVILRTSDFGFSEYKLSDKQ